MSINAIIDGTTYEDIKTILVGGKTITLSEVEDSASPTEYPTITFFNGANTTITNGKMTATDSDPKRACAFITESVNGGANYAVSAAAANAGFPTNAYPLYIPSGVTKITVACPNLCCAINVHNDVNGTVTAVDTGHWSSVGGETDYDLSTYLAQGATHLSIGFKNSANTSLADTTVDNTTVSISFS